MAPITMTNFEEDQLKEMINIGAGNAATAFSHMLGHKVQMNVPESVVGGIADVQQRLGISDDTVLAVFLKMYGDVEGALAIIFTPESALHFASILNKSSSKDLHALDEKDRSALREVGNILLGASITALGRFLNLNIVHSIPDIAIDMLGAVMDSIVIEMGKDSDVLLAFKVNLKIDDEGINGDLFYLFGPDASAKILDAAKKRMASTA